MKLQEKYKEIWDGKKPLPLSKEGINRLFENNISSNKIYNMNPEFKEVYKHGYDLDKIIPESIRECVNDWTEDQRVIFYKQNEGNFLLACIEDSEGNENAIYSFMRFFDVGNTVHCSVDFQSSSQIEMIHKLTEMLAKKHTF